MKPNRKNLRTWLLALSGGTALFSSLAANAGVTTTTFEVQQGNLLQDGNPFGTGTGYSGVVDGTISDNTSTFARTTTASSNLGNAFQASTNGRQFVGLFSYDLTELNNFITTNTGPLSSVTVQSASFQVISNGSNAGSSMGLNLFGTDPFTSSGCTWSNYTTGTPWTVPYQNIGSSAAYGFTGGGSALTPSLGGSNPNTAVTSGKASPVSRSQAAPSPRPGPPTPAVSPTWPTVRTRHF